MLELLQGLAVLTGVLRPVIFVAGLAVAVLAGLSFAVRTRRLNPFGSVGRLTRRSIDPLLAPVERRLLRVGGSPSDAPLWAAGAVIVGGILLLSLLDFVIGQLSAAAQLATAGPRGIVALLVRWIFGVLQLALIVRVVSSWFRVSPWSPWIRWSFTLTEWFLGPLRRVLPSLGGIDLSPLVAYFGLNLLEGIVLRLL